MLQKSRAKKLAKPVSSINYYCFKCKFFSTSEDLFNNHMTYLHLVPPHSVNGKFVALSNTSLLHSTFLPTSGVEEEVIPNENMLYPNYLSNDQSQERDEDRTEGWNEWSCC